MHAPAAAAARSSAAYTTHAACMPHTCHMPAHKQPMAATLLHAPSALPARTRRGRRFEDEGEAAVLVHSDLHGDDHARLVLQQRPRKWQQQQQQVSGSSRVHCSSSSSGRLVQPLVLEVRHRPATSCYLRLLRHGLERQLLAVHPTWQLSGCLVPAPCYWASTALPPQQRQLGNAPVHRTCVAALYSLQNCMMFTPCTWRERTSRGGQPAGNTALQCTTSGGSRGEGCAAVPQNAAAVAVWCWPGCSHFVWA